MAQAKVIGIIYHPLNPRALEKTKQVLALLGPGRQCWTESAADENTSNPLLDKTDLIITIGGDGTILRTAKAAVPRRIPILGVNMGRLGFMTELRADEALTRIPDYLDGQGWVEERAMLQAQVADGAGNPVPPDMRTHHALNDVVVGRGGTSRLIRVMARVDGAHLTTYRADAVIVSTATGSTGYNLSAGGPILHPQARNMIMKPVAPHVGLATAVVFPSTTAIELALESATPAIFSVDGYLDMPLSRGNALKITMSEHKALFLRQGPPHQFYATLTRRLGFEGGEGVGRPIFY